VQSINSYVSSGCCALRHSTGMCEQIAKTKLSHNISWIALVGTGCMSNPPIPPTSVCSFSSCFYPFPNSSTSIIFLDALFHTPCECEYIFHTSLSFYQSMISPRQETIKFTPSILVDGNDSYQSVVNIEDVSLNRLARRSRVPKEDNCKRMKKYMRYDTSETGTNLQPLLFL
jgi:hypothetical protein